LLDSLLQEFQNFIVSDRSVNHIVWLVGPDLPEDLMGDLHLKHQDPSPDTERILSPSPTIGLKTEDQEPDRETKNREGNLLLGLGFP